MLENGKAEEGAKLGEDVVAEEEEPEADAEDWTAEAEDDEPDDELPLTEFEFAVVGAAVESPILSRKATFFCIASIHFSLSASFPFVCTMNTLLIFFDRISNAHNFASLFTCFC